LQATSDEAKKRFLEVRQYVKDHFVPSPEKRMFSSRGGSASLPPSIARRQEEELVDSSAWQSSTDLSIDLPPAVSFASALLGLIDAKKQSDVEVYKKAGVDRKLFSKIRRDDYNPGKRTVFRFILALELDLVTAKELLEHAGFSFSRAAKTDLIVQYCVIHGIHDLMTVNELLFDHGEPALDE